MARQGDALRDEVARLALAVAELKGLGCNFEAMLHQINMRFDELRPGRGGAKVHDILKLGTPLFRTQRIKARMSKKIKTGNERGGHRAGAGRPAGRSNKPRLLRCPPKTPDPLQWLLALMNHVAAPMRLRVSAAVAQLPYLHARPG